MKKSVIIFGCLVLVAIAASLRFAPQVSKSRVIAETEQLPSANSQAEVPRDVSAVSTNVAANLNPVQRQRRESMVSAAPQAQAPQTFIGPDGKQHPIVYNQGLNLDAPEVRQMKAEIIKDMRAHPDAFIGLYGMEASDVNAIVAGKQDLPKELLAKLVM